MYVLLVIATSGIMMFSWFVWSALFFVFYILIVPTIIIALKTHYPDKPIYPKGAIGFFVSFLFYILAVMYIGMSNYNDFGNGPKWSENEKRQFDLYDRECQFYVLNKNHWLLETENVYVSNKKVFDYPEFLGILVKNIAFRKNATYRIYEQVEEIKTVKDNGFVEIKPIGKNLIMTIKK